jgi:hypothetical protein
MAKRRSVIRALAGATKVSRRRRTESEGEYLGRIVLAVIELPDDVRANSHRKRRLGAKRRSSTLLVK